MGIENPYILLNIFDVFNPVIQGLPKVAPEETIRKVKELTGVGSRCIPMEQEIISDKCVCCGKPAKKMIYWGRAY